MNNNIITKDDLRKTVEDVKLQAAQEGVEYSDKNAARDLRWFMPEEEKAAIKAVKTLKAEIKKQKHVLGSDETKKLLAGLEAMSYELDREEQITTSQLIAASVVNLNKESVTMAEEGVLNTVSKDIVQIQKVAQKKNKRLENKKISGVKIGEALELYKTEVKTLVSEVIKGRDAREVLDGLTRQQGMAL